MTFTHLVRGVGSDVNKISYDYFMQVVIAFYKMAQQKLYSRLTIENYLFL